MRFAIDMRSVESARGAERVAVNIARGLADRGHDLDFLVEDGNSWLIDEMRAHSRNLRVIQLRADDNSCTAWLQRVRAFAATLPTLPRALAEAGDSCVRPIAHMLYKDRPPIGALSDYLRDAQPRAVLSFLNYPNTVLLLAAGLAERRARIVVSVRNHVSTAAQHNTSRWLRTVPRLMRRLFERADAIIVPSQGVADDVASITRLPSERIRVIYNPVVRPELAQLASVPVDHDWFGDGREQVVVAAGKLKPQKDFATLLRAFAKVRAARPVRLVLLGQGSQEAALRALAAELNIDNAVCFAGQVANPFPYYRNADLFVLSSAWEGLPNALIEAMACGCPVVSTDCPSGPREILEGGQYGRLVPVGSADALAAAMLATLAEPARTETLLQRAGCFSLEQAVQRYEDILAT